MEVTRKSVALMINYTVEIAIVLLYKENHTERNGDLCGTEAKPVLGNKITKGDDEFRMGIPV